MNSKALSPKDKMNIITNFLVNSTNRIKAVLPKHMNPERMVRIVSTSISRNPLLLECDPLTIVASVITSSQLGLEPNGPLGQSYLVPYRNNKTGKYEAQFIIGYRGLIDLVRRSGNILSIEAHVVHENDVFELENGLQPKLRHCPTLGNNDPGQPMGVFAMAKFQGSAEIQSEFMSIKEINDIRARSKAKDFGPWVTDFEEMAKKTVVRRLCKYLPMSIELASAIEAEDLSDSGSSNIVDVIDAGVAETLKQEAIDSGVQKKTSTKSDKLAGELPGNQAPEQSDAADISPFEEPKAGETFPFEEPQAKQPEEREEACKELVSLLNARGFAEEKARKDLFKRVLKDADAKTITMSLAEINKVIDAIYAETA